MFWPNISVVFLSSWDVLESLPSMLFVVLPNYTCAASDIQSAQVQACTPYNIFCHTLKHLWAWYVPSQTNIFAPPESNNQMWMSMIIPPFKSPSLTAHPRSIWMLWCQSHSQHTFPSARFTNLLTHKMVWVMPATGSLAHTTHPTPTSTAANVNCNAGTLTDHWWCLQWWGLYTTALAFCQARLWPIESWCYSLGCDLVGTTHDMFMKKIGPNPWNSE